MMGYGGVLSFELKNASFATTFLNGLKSCQLTASLGTTDTLVQQPATMSHIFMPKAQREKYGITDGLIRLSIGIENENDLINDIAQALNLA